MYNNDTNASLYGGLAVGIPGELRGLEFLHQQHGSLPWKQLVEPAMRLARTGFRVTEDFVTYMNSTTPSLSFLFQDPAWAIDFAPTGKLVAVNDTMTRRRYADTLEVIAQQGAGAFYSGPLANATVEAIQSNGGIITPKDLKEYAVRLRHHVSIKYHKFRLYGIGAPSSGPVVLGIMNTVQGYNMSDPKLLNLTTHRLDEAIRFGYGERTKMGDPLFVANFLQYQADMLSNTTAAIIRSKISDSHTQNISAYDPGLLASLDIPGTAEITTADASGMAVSLTTTINTSFGSQVIVPETGVILNNEMNDFSIPGVSNNYGYAPSPDNYIEPGKTPLSSMSPTIVEHQDGSFYLSTGAGGGSRIITSNVQNLWHILDQNLTTANALAMPRFHDQLIPNQITFEYAYNNQTVSYLAELGHNVSWVAPGQAHCQAIRRLPNGTFEASAEPRMLSSGGYAF